MFARLAISVATTAFLMAMAGPVLAISTAVTIDSATLTDKQTITLTGTIA
jgi:hypothetical protein